MKSLPVKVLAAVSPKGGVGKTTLVANLAVALAARGQSVLTVDLDPQNALRLHHQMPVQDISGIAIQSLRGEAWSSALYRSSQGLTCLPYGALIEDDRREFERMLETDPRWLEKSLASLNLAPGSWVILDTPPGGTIYLRQALNLCDGAFSLLLPDAASFVTIPAMERWFDDYCRSRAEFRGGWYLVNRMNTARVLCRDVLAALQAQLGTKLVPQSVHFDAAVEEALASQAPVSHYAPDSVATRDIGVIADWILRQL